MTKFDAKHIDSLVEKYTAPYTSANRVITESYQYMLFSGGKRMRPLLMLNTANALGKIDENLERLVVAMECIHSYSLVHDDLPCMDNDDLRRGKPTVHRKYNEAIAVLCGDGLLTMSMQVVSCGSNSEQYINAVKTLYNSAQNLVLGQSDDLSANSFIDINRYFDIISEKTGGIIRDCLLIPAQYFKCKSVDLLESIGNKVGILYQISDDILDGKTEETSILNVMNKNDAKKLLNDLTLEVGQLILDFEEREKVDMQYLKDFIEFNVSRRV